MKSLKDPRDVATTRARVAGLTERDVARWGVMNAVEMVCHVRSAYQLALSDSVIDDVPIPLPRPLMKFLALKLPIKWPKSVPTVPSLKVGMPALAPSLVSFAEDKRTLVEALEMFSTRPALTKDHPIFGNMRHDDWMRWGYLHADHHLRQFGR